LLDGLVEMGFDRVLAGLVLENQHWDVDAVAGDKLLPWMNQNQMGTDRKL
jgi:hypothetical protein